MGLNTKLVKLYEQGSPCKLFLTGNQKIDVGVFNRED